MAGAPARHCSTGHGMYKLILLFHENPAIPDLVERWSREFVPLADQLPGLQAVVVSHVEGGPAGPSDIRLIHELIFDDKDALTAAMQSAPGVQAGQGLVRLTQSAPRTVTLLFADHLQDKPRPDHKIAPPAFP